MAVLEPVPKMFNLQTGPDCVQHHLSAFLPLSTPAIKPFFSTISAAPVAETHHQQWIKFLVKTKLRYHLYYSNTRGSKQDWDPIVLGTVQISSRFLPCRARGSKSVEQESDILQSFL